MTAGTLRSFIENMADGAPVSFVTCGPAGECIELDLLEYDDNASGGISFWVQLPEKDWRVHRTG